MNPSHSHGIASTSHPRELREPVKLSLASSSGHGLTPEIEQAIGDCLSALERGAIAEATAALGRLLAANTRLFPRSWLERTIAALGQNAWGGLSEPFASSEFVGPGDTS